MPPRRWPWRSRQPRSSPRSRPRPSRSERTPDPLGEARTHEGDSAAPSRARPLRQRVGAAGESAAIEFLERRGLRVLARDWRCRLGQLDIVCEDGGTTVAVEVKARRGIGYGLPQEAVDWRKRQKLRRLLEAFQAATGRQTQPCRIDVLGLILDAELRPRRVEHIRNAVEGEG